MEFIIQLLLANDRGIKKTAYWGTSYLFFSYCAVKSHYICACEHMRENPYTARPFLILFS
jgi:hypothetical protein